MVVSDELTYAEVYGTLEEATQRLGRTVNVTIYTTQELERRLRELNPFLTKVLGRPRLWIIGSDDELAERTHISAGTLARSLLSTALDEAAPDPASIVELLDAIPGAYDRAQRGLDEARSGKGVPLDEL